MIPVTDRTSVEADETCGMKRWWFLHEEGRGIVPATEPPPLRDGIAIHASLAALLESQALSLPDPPAEEDQELWESWARQVGWLVAFHEWVWPQWFEPFYDIVDIEKELVISRPRIWVALTPDIVLRSKATGKLVVIDFKSVGMQGKEWHESWPFAIQLHLNQRGVAEEYEEPVSFALVVGLNKGQARDGKLRHPYVWAYSDGEDGWSADWRKNWNLRPTWEYGSGGAEGIKEWVLSLGPDVGLSQFPVSVPVVEDRTLVEEWLEERADREAEVADFLSARLTMQPQEIAPAFKKVFPKRRINCKKAMGGACPYLHACWNADVGNDPLGSGIYVRRIPHHDVEVGHD